MSATNRHYPNCTVANPTDATAQLSLKQLAWRVLSDGCTVASLKNATMQHPDVADVAQVAPVDADKPNYKLRLHLLALAEQHGFGASHIHRLHNLDVAACAGLDDPQLVIYLELLHDTATRWAGKVPTGHTAAIQCHHCGPVWVHPGMAAVLPVVDGWPRALGCPWCAIRKAGQHIPRPSSLHGMSAIPSRLG